MTTKKGGAPLGSANAQKHGGEAGVRALSKGEPLHGPAREAELMVRDELETTGRYSLIKRNAVRLQAVADLFWVAIQKAAEDQDIKALDRYVARFGWLAGASLRAWAQLGQEKPDTSIDYEKLLEDRQ